MVTQYCLFGALVTEISLLNNNRKALIFLLNFTSKFRNFSGRGNRHCFIFQLFFISRVTTVEPVLSGPVLSGHPLLSGQLSKSRKLVPLITVILTSIKRSPLLSGRGHPLLSPDELFLLS